MKMSCIKILKHTKYISKCFISTIQQQNSMYIYIYSNKSFILTLTYKAILVDQVGKVRTIGINRPEKRNCLDSDTIIALEKAIEDFENDNNSLSGVLYGIGGNFCSGYDLEEIAVDNEPTNLLKRALVITVLLLILYALK